MLIAPGAGDHGDPRERDGRATAQPHWERRVVGDGLQLIARGALICPGCELPIALAAPHPASAGIECGFCGHQAPAWTLVRPGIADTGANSVALIARLPA